MSEEQLDEQQPELSPEERAIILLDGGDLPEQEETTPEETPEVEAAPPEETPEDKPVDDPHARKFAALDRKAKEIREREEQLKTQEAESQSLKAQFEELKAKIAKAKDDPDAFLELGGVSYDEITDFKLHGGRPAESKIDELNQKIEKLQRDTEEKERRTAEESRLSTEQQQIENYKVGLREFVKANIDKFSLIGHYGESAINAIMDYSANHYAETSQIGEAEVLSYEQLCDYAESEYDKQADALIAVNKIKQKFSVSNDTTKPKSRPQARRSTTLSNAQQSESSGVDARTLTDEEIQDKAAKLLKWD